MAITIGKAVEEEEIKISIRPSDILSERRVHQEVFNYLFYFILFYLYEGYRVRKHPFKLLQLAMYTELIKIQISNNLLNL